MVDDVFISFLGFGFKNRQSNEANSGAVEYADEISSTLNGIERANRSLA
jgi:hypothetical protein